MGKGLTVVLLKRTREARSLACIVMLCVIGCQASNLSPTTMPSHSWSVAQEQTRRRVMELTGLAHDARKAGKRDSARNLLKEAVSLDGADGPAQHLLGVVYFEQGNLYNAAIHLDVASRLMSDRYEPCYNLGRVLEAGGQYEQAISSYQRSLSRRVDHIETLENLARVRVKAGYHDEETLRLLTRCVDRESRPEWSSWLELQILRLRGKLEHAKEVAPVTKSVSASAPAYVVMPTAATK